MARITTRTETASIQLQMQVEDYIKEEHTTYAGFRTRYLPDMSYQTFSNAIKGDPSTPEVLEAIDAALSAAQRDQLRRSRTHCPHCAKPLD